MLKVMNLNGYKPRLLCEVDTYAEAWEAIYENEMKESPCICKKYKNQMGCVGYRRGDIP